LACYEDARAAVKRKLGTSAIFHKSVRWVLGNEKQNHSLTVAAQRLRPSGSGGRSWGYSIYFPAFFSSCLK
jgi:hypothetical protein